MTVGFLRPRHLDEALEALGDDDAMPVAGGVALGLLTNLGLVSASRLVAIGRLPGLRGVAIGENGDELVLGAATPHGVLAVDPLLVEELPAAAAMFGHIGNIRVRAWGTVGGNLALAEPAQDPPVLLAALGAEVVTAGPSGCRRLPVATLSEGPMTTALVPGELITHVAVPRLGPDERCAYLKFMPTTADDYATVSAAVRCRVADGVVTQARIFCGSVGPVPVDCTAAAARLVGRSGAADDLFDDLHDPVADAVSPVADHRGDADYKREMAGIFVRRAVERALAGDGA